MYGYFLAIVRLSVQAILLKHLHFQVKLTFASDHHHVDVLNLIVIQHVCLAHAVTVFPEFLLQVFITFEAIEGVTR